MFHHILRSKFDEYQTFTRRKMVEDQIVARGIKNGLVIEAMEKVKRHQFVPDYLANRAYEDSPLPIAHEQTISQPYIVALMTELLALKSGDKVLEIGTGSGYQTAVLAELAKEIYTIEYHSGLADQAKAVLDKEGYTNIKFRTGNGALGWPEAAPYDAIIATCAPVQEVPPKLLEQLADKGRLVIPLGEGIQQLKLFVKDGDKITGTAIADVRFVPMLK